MNFVADVAERPLCCTVHVRAASDGKVWVITVLQRRGGSGVSGATVHIKAPEKACGPCGGFLLVVVSDWQGEEKRFFCGYSIGAAET